MESKRITCRHQCVVFAIAHVFVFSCLLTCWCGCEASSRQQVSSTDYYPQKERIEHVAGVKLPESARNCRYDSEDYGMGHGVGWGFFEISRSDLQYLLDASDNLPDATELGQNPGARENIERAMQQAGKSMTWWKPLTLQKRRYAEKIIERMGLVGNRQIDICAGEIRDGLIDTRWFDGCLPRLSLRLVMRIASEIH